MRVLAICALLSILPLNVLGAGDAHEAKACDGALVVTPATELDLGKVDAQDVRSFKVTVKNTSKAPITIQGIQVSCGCTVVSLPPNTRIEGGADLEIPISFNPHGFFGYVTKVLTIQSTDPACPTFTWTFHATVDTPILLQPKALSLTAMEDADKPVSQEFAFLPATRALKVKRIWVESTAARAVEVDWKQTRGEIHGTVTLDPRKWKPAERAKDRALIHPDRLMVELEDGYTDFIQVYWSLQAVVNVNPHEVAFVGSLAALNNGGAPLASDANLNSSSTFKVLGVKSSLPDMLTATFEPGSDPHFAVVHVLWKGRTAGRYAERLTVQTDNPRFPEVEVPVNVVIN